MKKPQPKAAKVSQTTTITPNMQRITLESEAFAAFPADCEGGYIKLLFDAQGRTDIHALAEDERPLMRTYTIRSFMPQQNSIEVDFVRHTCDDPQSGFAARWAMSAQVGDTIHIAGPGTIQNMNLQADWFFMVADMTALPALSAKIRRLPKQAKGYAVIKIESEADKQALDAPENMQIIWLTEQTISQAVYDLEWLEGEVSVWCACEFDAMRAMRQYFRNDKHVDRDNIYISSYWKHGVTEDGHKVIKRQDMEQNR